MSDSPKPKRRWNQFSLKTLLLVMTLFTVSVGGWVQYMRQRAQENRERQAAAVEKTMTKIEQLGGKCFRVSDRRRSQTWLEKQFGDPGGPDDPVAVHAVSVMFDDTQITDTDLKQLRGLTNISLLFLGNTEVNHLRRE